MAGANVVLYSQLPSQTVRLRPAIDDASGRIRPPSSFHRPTAQHNNCYLAQFQLERMISPDDAAQYAVRMQDVADDTISIVSDIAWAVCQMPTGQPATNDHSMSPPTKNASIEVNFDGVQDTIISAQEGRGDDENPIESVVVVPRGRRREDHMVAKRNPLRHVNASTLRSERIKEARRRDNF
jgi:hypothetical protein